MNEEELRQQIRDEEHLKMLVLGYKISAGFVALYSLFGFIYVFMGAMLVLIPDTAASGEAPPLFVGLMFAGIGVVFVLGGLAIAGVRWAAARRLEQRRSLVFCQVIAALTCLEMPYGTALGVLTFVVTGRPSVKRLFA